MMTEKFHDLVRAGVSKHFALMIVMPMTWDMAIARVLVKGRFKQLLFFKS